MDLLTHVLNIRRRGDVVMNTDNVMLPNVNSSKNTSIKRNYLQKAKDFFSALISNKAALLGLIIILILIITCNRL